MARTDEGAVRTFDPPGPHILTRVGRSCVIGRADLADVRCHDPLVSTLHAVVSTLGGRWQLRDLGSRNGTLVNGQRVDQQVFLDHGDWIRVGDTVFQFVPERPAEGDARPGEDLPSTIVLRMPDLQHTFASAALREPSALSALVTLSGIVDLAHGREPLIRQAVSVVADAFEVRHVSLWLGAERAIAWGAEPATPGTPPLVETSVARHQATAAHLPTGGFAVAVPVSARRAELGAIYLEREAPFTRDELELATIFATKIALALENDELNERLRRANAELLDANAGLEREVARRTAEVQRLAEQRRDMLGMVAHDVRGALGLVSLLSSPQSARRRGAAEPIALELIDQIDGRVRRTIDLLSGLLDAEALAEGTIKLRRETVDVAQVAEALAGPLRASLRERRLELAVEATTPAPLADTDPARLEQVLQNLLSNALKHTSEGRIVVKVETLGRRVVVAVSDTGSGMPPEVVARLFKPFTIEAGRGRSRVGLGLAIAHRLVDLLGGAITAESEVGKGTTVRFDLPATASR